MRPRHCRYADQDLCCLGCGAHLNCLKPDQCYYEDCEKAEALERDKKDRAEYERLKLKFEAADKQCGSGTQK